MTVCDRTSSRSTSLRTILKTTWKKFCKAYERQVTVTSARKVWNTIDRKWLFFVIRLKSRSILFREWLATRKLRSMRWFIHSSSSWRRCGTIVSHSLWLLFSRQWKLRVKMSTARWQLRTFIRSFPREWATKTVKAKRLFVTCRTTRMEILSRESLLILKGYDGCGSLMIRY